jgi:hypothetical protein
MKTCSCKWWLTVCQEGRMLAAQTDVQISKGNLTNTTHD